MKTSFQDIKVGDLIRVYDHQSFPADCLLVKIENESNECFIKTVALDGERNLKPKVPVRSLATHFQKIFDPARQVKAPALTVKTMRPIKDLYTYNGRLSFDVEGQQFTENIDMNTFLHRDSFLENSTSVIALVIHTGMDSKIMMNMGAYKFKQSRFEKVLNAILIGNLVMALALNIINVVLYGRWTKAMLNSKKARYLFFKLLPPGVTKVPAAKLAI